MRIEGKRQHSESPALLESTAPDVHALPVGNAGLYHRVLEGLHQYHQLGLIDPSCRMLGIGPGAAPLVLGEPVSHPETIATAIRINSPASWTSAVEAQRVKGRFLAASDEERYWLHITWWLVSKAFVEPRPQPARVSSKAIDDGWVAHVVH